jgi:hypothetical protein
LRRTERLNGFRNPRHESPVSSGLTRPLFQMKHCSYCGRDNDDASANCAGCGEALTVDAPDPPLGFVQALYTPRGIAITTALGILLITGALFLAVGTAAVQSDLLPGKPAEGYGSPYAIITTSMIPARLIVVAAIFPVFFLCRARFRRQHASMLALGILLAALILAVLPKVLPAAVILWCIPGVVLGQSSGSAGVLYVGTLLQIGVGAWLLFRFRPGRSTDDGV